MIYMGIDPGKKGGIGLIEICCGKVEAVKVFPIEDLVDIVRKIDGEDCICVLEKVSAMPHQGVVSMFNFGVGFGYIKGVLEFARIPYQEIRPQVWKKEFNLNGDKEKSIEVCKRLYPFIDLKRTERCRTESDGLAEGLLMAEYGRRKL